MTNLTTLLHSNAIMHGALDRVNASLASYFDKMEESGCQPFIDPALGEFVESTLEACNQILDNEAVHFFETAELKARGQYPAKDVDVPQPTEYDISSAPQRHPKDDEPAFVKRLREMVASVPGATIEVVQLDDRNPEPRVHIRMTPQEEKAMRDDIRARIDKALVETLLHSRPERRGEERDK